MDRWGTHLRHLELFFLKKKEKNALNQNQSFSKSTSTLIHAENRLYDYLAENSYLLRCCYIFEI